MPKNIPMNKRVANFFLRMAAEPDLLSDFLKSRRAGTHATAIGQRLFRNAGLTEADIVVVNSVLTMDVSARVRLRGTASDDTQQQMFVAALKVENSLINPLAPRKTAGRRTRKT